MVGTEPATATHPTQHTSKIGWGWWLAAIVGAAVAVAVVVVALVASLRSGREIDPNQVMLALIALLSSLGSVIIPRSMRSGRTPRRQRNTS